MGLVWQASKKPAPKGSSPNCISPVCISFVCMAYVYIKEALKSNNEKPRADPDITSI